MTVAVEVTSPSSRTLALPQLLLVLDWIREDGAPSLLEQDDLQILASTRPTHSEHSPRRAPPLVALRTLRTVL